MEQDERSRWAERLLEARREARPLPGDILADLAVDDAYRLQGRLVELSFAAGMRVAGWKVGLTSPPALAAFGAREPMVGRIFAETVLESGATLDPRRTCDPRVEGEILIEVGNRPAWDCDREELVRSIRSVRAAIEVADSRIRSWPGSVGPATADDACCGWVVVGEHHALGSLDLAALEMSMAADDVQVSEGRGSNCLGGPLEVYRWFLRKAEKAQWKVEPGHLLLTGAMGPAVPARSGTRYEVRVSSLGSVVLTFGERSVD